MLGALLARIAKSALPARAHLPCVKALRPAIGGLCASRMFDAPCTCAHGRTTTTSQPHFATTRARASKRSRRTRGQPRSITFVAAMPALRAAEPHWRQLVRLLSRTLDKWVARIVLVRGVASRGSTLRHLLQSPTLPIEVTGSGVQATGSPCRACRHPAGHAYGGGFRPRSPPRQGHGQDPG